MSIDDLLPSQTQDEVAGSRGDVCCMVPQVWFILPKPKDLRTDCLAGECHSAEIVDYRFAPFLVKFIDLVSCPRIHTIKQPRSQRSITFIQRQHARTNRADCHCSHICSPVRISIQQLAADLDCISPPGIISILFRPAGVWN